MNVAGGFSSAFAAATAVARAKADLPEDFSSPIAKPATMLSPQPVAFTAEGGGEQR